MFSVSLCLSLPSARLIGTIKLFMILLLPLSRLSPTTTNYWNRSNFLQLSWIADEGLKYLFHSRQRLLAKRFPTTQRTRHVDLRPKRPSIPRASYHENKYLNHLTTAVPTTARETDRTRDIWTLSSIATVARRDQCTDGRTDRRKLCLHIEKLGVNIDSV